MDKPKAVSTEAEILRLVLPLLSKYGIPPSPINYAIWYEYVAREKMGMRKEVMELLERHHGNFSSEDSFKLFKKYIADYNEAELLNVRDNIQKLSADLLRTVRDLAGETSTHQDILENFTSQLTDIHTSDKSKDQKTLDLQQMISELIDHTRNMSGASQVFRASLHAANQEIQLLRSELEKIRQEADTDSLTGLHNRRAFDKELADSYANLDPEKDKITLIMIDLDHFKMFNDKYGHLWGDKVLKHVAEVLKQELKGRDFLARFGGEEFAVLLFDTEPDASIQVAKALCSAVESYRIKSKNTQKSIDKITISLGVALLKQGESINSFIQRADQALYEAKAAGRNQVKAAL